VPPDAPAATATLFDIQRFSLHDGPGVRTTLFFKGCALACDWCQNPESHAFRPELAYYAERCIDSGACRVVCPQGAIGGARASRVDWARCTHCGRCAELCDSEALRLIGRDWGAEALVTECLRDETFYRNTGGGVTLSGGEAVLQHRFLAVFLPRLRAAGVPVALQTAGEYSWRALASLLPWLDHVFYDLKCGLPETHLAMTGRDGGRVWANLGRLAASGVPFTVRMPVVPGRNTSPEEIAALAGRLRGFGLANIVLLRYNALWEAKLPRLARPPRAPGLAHDPAGFEAVRRAFARQGIAARAADEESGNEERG
jgi:pyruvate formate lyase activating enzyme